MAVLNDAGLRSNAAASCLKPVVLFRSAPHLEEKANALHTSFGLYYMMRARASFSQQRLNRNNCSTEQPRFVWCKVSTGWWLVVVEDKLRTLLDSGI